MLVHQFISGRWQQTSCLRSDVIKELYKLATKFPESEFIVQEEGIDIADFNTSIEEKRGKHYFISNHAILNSDFGYVEDSPFIKVNPKVLYATWKKSTACFYMHAALIVQVSRTFSVNEDLLYWLNSVAKVVQPQGVFCYQTPTNTSYEVFTTDELYRFVKQHYKRRWTLLLLLCHIIYEKRFPLFAFAKAQFYRARNCKITFPLPKEPNVTEPFKYDVVIPTLGREKYLKLVLNDLNEQAIPPQTVIVIEQSVNNDVYSKIDFSTKGNWNYHIIHKVINVTGACNARNTALSYVESPWVLFFDDDVRVKKIFATQIRDFLTSKKLNAVTFSCLQKGEIEIHQKAIQWPTFGSGCSIVSSHIANNATFDMALEHGYGEDTDYGMQIRNAGYDVIYAPNIKMKHLKAPIGGFRTKKKFPWKNDKIQPKPSPQVMYYRLKNTTTEQLRGYKLVLFFKFYIQQNVKNPIRYTSNFKKAWNLSLGWSNKLPLNE